jgi:hypothetical protein
MFAKIFEVFKTELTNFVRVNCDFSNQNKLLLLHVEIFIMNLINIDVLIWFV